MKNFQCNCIPGFILLFLLACDPVAQSPSNYIQLQYVATLPKSLKETSGLASCADTSYYVHNDSGNKPRLYQISAVSGEIQREIRIKDAKNNDWEELAEDNTHIYIGDFGNNTGMRTNLMIYSVSKHDLGEKDEVKAGIIHYEYPDHASFTARGKHNHDCEAMVAIEDSLYLFSKNRGDLATDVYRLPKKPGRNVAQHVGHFNSQGLITAADFLPGESNMLVLLGYETAGNTYKSFLWLFTGFNGTDFFEGTQRRIAIAPDLQAEAVLFDSDSTLIITNEEEKGGLGRINRIVIGK